MRVIGKNFAAPSGYVARNANSESDSESEMELSGAHWNNILERMFEPSMEYVDDPEPYELQEGYDASDPRFPDRRWHVRVESDRVVAPEEDEEELWQDHLPTYAKVPPFFIQPAEFDRQHYRQWLQIQRLTEEDETDDDTGSESDPIEIDPHPLIGENPEDLHFRFIDQLLRWEFRDEDAQREEQMDVAIGG